MSWMDLVGNVEDEKFRVGDEKFRVGDEKVEI